MRSARLFLRHLEAPLVAAAGPPDAAPRARGRGGEQPRLCWPAARCGTHRGRRGRVPEALGVLPCRGHAVARGIRECERACRMSTPSSSARCHGRSRCTRRSELHQCDTRPTPCGLRLVARSACRELGRSLRYLESRWADATCMGRGDGHRPRADASRPQVLPHSRPPAAASTSRRSCPATTSSSAASSPRRLLRPPSPVARLPRCAGSTPRARCWSPGAARRLRVHRRTRACRPRRVSRGEPGPPPPRTPSSPRGHGVPHSGQRRATMTPS